MPDPILHLKKNREICFIIASYLSLICLIMASYIFGNLRRTFVSSSSAWWVVTIHGPSEDNLNVQTWHRSYYVAPAAHSEEQLQPQQYCNIVTGGQFYNCALCRVTQARRRCWRQSKKRISKACAHCTQTNISFVGFQRFCFNGASITLLHCFC